MKNIIDTAKFRAKEGKQINLKKWPTLVKPLYESENDHEEMLLQQVEELSKLQSKLYASNQYSLLVIFQAMDAAGKDSAIRRVMTGVNPQGCQVYSFQHPSETELDHDFLWRSAVCLPERGRIGIFNRSYYEEVLIVRVHKEILAAQHLPDEASKKKKKLWPERFRSIRNFEDHLQHNGTRILKFFLHVSKEEQRTRFLKRIDNPDKNWKITPDDIRERAYWNDYQKAYEDCISETTTEDAPWYVVPADDKANAHLIISQVILEAMRDLKLEFPSVDTRRKKELKEMRKTLEK